MCSVKWLAVFSLHKLWLIQRNMRKEKSCESKSKLVGQHSTVVRAPAHVSQKRIIAKCMDTLERQSQPWLNFWYECNFRFSFRFRETWASSHSVWIFGTRIIRHFLNLPTWSMHASKESKTIFTSQVKGFRFSFYRYYLCISKREHFSDTAKCQRLNF